MFNQTSRKGENNMEVIEIIFFIVIFWLICKVPEWKHDNRTCAPGKKIDYDKATYDLNINKIGKQEYFRRYNNGYYDIN